MVKQFLKKKSKRQTTRQRTKIEKKVRVHNRKLKKLAKLQAKGKKGKKLIIVPGDCPFKEKILAEATLLKENILKERLAKKELAKAEKKARKEKSLPVAHPSDTVKKIKAIEPPTGGDKDKKKSEFSFENLLKKAQERGYQFEQIQQKKVQADPSLKAFYREFQTVVSESDVVIQVLDSRDPLGTRSEDAENSVRSQTDKKLMFVLNKCDLVPPDNLQKWVTYLKQATGCAVIPFKANTQKQKDRLGSVGAVNTTTGTDTKKSVGVGDLMGILGSWARGEAGGITVGVIGMPNVGKSSLINSLKRSKACNVGAKAGVTRTCQVIHLDSKLRLIDSPGICFSKETGNEAISLDKILARVPKTTIMLHYRIPDFEDSEEFLCHVANKYGHLKKGGIPNTAAAEHRIVTDWHTGAIRFFTEPPEIGSRTTSAAIVSTMAKPFSIDNFVSSASQDEEMEDIENEDDQEEAMSDNDEDDEDEQPSTPAKPSPSPRKPSPRLTRSAAKKKGLKVEFAVDLQGSELMNRRRSTKRQQHEGETISPKNQKKLGLATPKTVLMKKIKKAKKKSAKKADELSEVVKGMTLDL